MIVTPVSDRQSPAARARFALVLLRTVIAWHFLYEGYYKAVLPAWSGTGDPLRAWSAAGYLTAATGPLAGVFRQLASPPFAGVVDTIVILALIGIGLSLMLGLFTQAGCLAALALLTLFYLAHIPFAGVPEAGAEGTYLLVNKTLVEWTAVLTLWTQRTGLIAGLDRLRLRTADDAAASPVPEEPLLAERPTR